MKPKNGTVAIASLPLNVATYRVQTALGAWTEVLTHRVYVPNSANTLYINGMVYVVGATTGYLRLVLGAATGTGVTFTSTVGEYVEANVDVSAIAEGWYVLSIQMYNSGGNNSTMDGFTIVWGP